MGYTGLAGQKLIGDEPLIVSKTVGSSMDLFYNLSFFQGVTKNCPLAWHWVSPRETISEVIGNPLKN